MKWPPVGWRKWPRSGHVQGRFERLTAKAPGFAGGYLLQTSTALTIVTAIVGAFGATAVYLHMADKLHQAKVIMDLTIPGGMGGKEAVREILEIDPDAMVIVSSGYADDPVMAA